ncbi:MAG: TetR family transcriptional regulator [Flavobacteriaceae bacterium]|nr:MAG: TetR family transcriptional regulator [Flavobacteriaceae bacterium]
MKCKILEKAGEMFLNFGFKSVTMDEIADELGISKKTIYANYKNKNVLIEAATMSLFEMISQGIDCICDLEKNPIEELFEIKRFIHTNLKDEKSSPYYQLQKYYPSIFHTLKMRQLELMDSCVTQNLKRGISLNLYRKEIDLNFISRIYFVGVTGIKDQETFPVNQFETKHLNSCFLNYHIRAICTEKGKQKLEKLLPENEK